MFYKNKIEMETAARIIVNNIDELLELNSNDYQELIESDMEHVYNQIQKLCFIHGKPHFGVLGAIEALSNIRYSITSNGIEFNLSGNKKFEVWSLEKALDGMIIKTPLKH